MGEGVEWVRRVEWECMIKEQYYCGLRWVCKNNSTQLPKPQNMNIITTISANTCQRLNCAIINIIHCLWFVERNAIHGTTVVGPAVQIIEI